MPEFGGLQIEPRCVKCNRLATADIPLYEMQNHRYICHECHQRSELEGKHIAWANSIGAQTNMVQVAAAPRPTQTLNGLTQPLRSGPLKANLPPDSLFAVLEIPLDTPLAQIKEMLRQQMRAWAKKTSDPAYKTMNERLRRWNAEIQDDIAFEEMREKLKVLARGNVGSLSVGGRSVFTAQEFRKACEELSEGWRDGVRYLRTGELWKSLIFAH
jgi:hypothetical protein